MSRMMDKVPSSAAALQHGRLARERPALDDDGHDFSENNPQPHTGSVISRVFGPKGDLPASIILPVKIGNTGTSTPHGQAAGLSRQRARAFFLGTTLPTAIPVANLIPPKGLSEFRPAARRELFQRPGQLAAPRRNQVRAGSRHRI